MNLLVVWVLGFQDKTAEEIFRKMEEAFERAKTVQVKFKCEGAGKKGEKKGKLSVSGTFLMKEGNKVFLSSKEEESEGEREFLYISDGVNMVSEHRDLPKVVHPRLKNDLAQSFVRAGFYFGCQMTMMEHWQGKAENVDLVKSLPVSEVMVEESGSERCLNYAVTVPMFGKSPLQVKLFYDPKSWAVLRRVVNAFGIGEENATFTWLETYEPCVLNGDISDQEFNLKAAPGAEGKAKLEEDLRRWKEEIDEYSKRIASGEAHWITFMSRAGVYASLANAEASLGRDARENFRRAIEDYDRAEKADRAGDSENLDNLFFSRGDARLALAEFEKAAGRDAKKQFEGALSDFAEVLKLAPDSYDILMPRMAKCRAGMK